MENALYYDERLAEVVAVGVPDEKLGELVAAIVTTKPPFHATVKESELLELARSKYVSFLRAHGRGTDDKSYKVALLRRSCYDHHPRQAVR